MKTNQISIKRVKFHHMPDFIVSAEQWAEIGGWKGFLKENGISIAWVKCVKTETMSYEEFHSLGVWEG